MKSAGANDLLHRPDPNFFSNFHIRYTFTITVHCNNKCIKLIYMMIHITTFICNNFSRATEHEVDREFELRHTVEAFMMGAELDLKFPFR